jgi:hypothetical protein
VCLDIEPSDIGISGLPSRVHDRRVSMQPDAMAWVDYYHHARLLGSGLQRRDCLSGFMTLPPVLLPEQPDVVLLFERALVSWSLAIDERAGHQDLCGSGRRSVTPYVHRRIELYCPSLVMPV